MVANGECSCSKRWVALQHSVGPPFRYAAWTLQEFQSICDSASKWISSRKHDSAEFPVLVTPTPPLQNMTSAYVFNQPIKVLEGSVLVTYATTQSLQLCCTRFWTSLPYQSLAQQHMSFLLLQCMPCSVWFGANRRVRDIAGTLWADSVSSFRHRQSGKCFAIRTLSPIRETTSVRQHP
jgi:hypothetical protein